MKNKGRYENSSGYVYILSKKHPMRNKMGYVREHRLIMERKIGRYLDKKEVVHHINQNRKDNRIENLKLFKSNGEHISYTRKGHTDTPRKFEHHLSFPKAIENYKIYIKRKPYVTTKCIICNKLFWTKERVERPITKACSKECFRVQMSDINKNNWRERRESTFMG